MRCIFYDSKVYFFLLLLFLLPYLYYSSFDNNLFGGSYTMDLNFYYYYNVENLLLSICSQVV